SAQEHQQEARAARLWRGPQQRAAARQRQAPSPAHQLSAGHQNLLAMGPAVRAAFQVGQRSMNSGALSSSMFHSWGEAAWSSACRVAAASLGWIASKYSALDSCGNGGRSVGVGASVLKSPADPEPIALAISKRVVSCPGPAQDASFSG